VWQPERNVADFHVRHIHSVSRRARFTLNSLHGSTRRAAIVCPR
jgi:hypothetical protein